MRSPILLPRFFSFAPMFKSPASAFVVPTHREHDHATPLLTLIAPPQAKQPLKARPSRSCTVSRTFCAFSIYVRILVFYHEKAVAGRCPPYSSPRMASVYRNRASPSGIPRQSPPGTEPTGACCWRNLGVMGLMVSVARPTACR